MKYLMPVGAVALGLGASLLLQAAGVQVALAKGLGLVVALAVVVIWWRRKARA